MQGGYFRVELDEGLNIKGGTRVSSLLLQPKHHHSLSSQTKSCAQSPMNQNLARWKTIFNDANVGLIDLIHLWRSAISSNVHYTLATTSLMPVTA